MQRLLSLTDLLLDFLTLGTYGLTEWPPIDDSDDPTDWADWAVEWGWPE